MEATAISQACRPATRAIVSAAGGRVAGEFRDDGMHRDAAALAVDVAAFGVVVSSVMVFGLMAWSGPFRP
jgi:hypothetical protein